MEPAYLEGGRQAQNNQEPQQDRIKLKNQSILIKNYQNRISGGKA